MPEGHMILKDELRELAERLDKKAITKLGGYLDTNERRSTYDGSDRLEDAERLLNCAAALRARASALPTQPGVVK